MDFSWSDIIRYASYTLVGCAYGGYLLVKKAKEAKEAQGRETPQEDVPEQAESLEPETEGFHPTREEALFLLAATGYEDELQALLDDGMDVDTRDADGRTPLMYTASVAPPEGESESAKELVDKVDTLLCERGDDNTYTWIEREQTPVRMTRYLLDHGADVHARDKAGFTPLIHAATCWPTEKEVPHPGAQIISMLLAAGADVDAADNEGLTALHYAAKKGQAAPVETLLAAGADTKIRTKDGRDFVDFLAEGGLTDILRKVVTEQKPDLEAPDAQGRTRLMRLAESGTADSIELLLELGADMHAKDKDGLSVYDHYLRAESVAKLLPFINRGMDIPAAGKADSWLIAAVSYGDAKLMQRIIDHLHQTPESEAMKQALRYAVQKAKGGMVELLLAAGVDPNTAKDKDDKEPFQEGHHCEGDLLTKIGPDKDGCLDKRTFFALMKAGANVHRWQSVWESNACLLAVAGGGTPEMMQMLVDAGVDPAKSDAGQLLEFAAVDKNRAMVDHLLDTVKISQKQLNGALDSAVYNGCKEIAGHLIERGAKVRKSTMVIAAEGKDPAMLRWLLDLGYKGDWGDMLLAAAAEVRDGQVRLLLERGAKVSRRDEDGRTALMRAICTFDHPAFAREDIVRALLAAGADPDAKDAKGYTPIISALCWLGYWGRRIIPMLVQAGADIPATTPKGKPTVELLEKIPCPGPIAKALEGRV